MRWLWRRMPLVPAVLLGSACGVTDTDEPTPVASIVVTPEALEVATGASAALEAEVTDDAGNIMRGRRVVWASSKPSIATVSENGIVTGVSAGRADIAATAEGKSDVATVTVVPGAARVATVRIVPDNIDLVVAAGTNLIATAYDSRGSVVGGRTIIWMTNNATVASISQSGRVTGLVPGTAIITAVIDGAVGNANVVVRLVPVANVAVIPSSVIIAEGKSATLTARLTDAAGNILTGRTVAWSSGDTRIVTVDQAGVVRGVRKGSVVISATSEGKLGTATVKVQ